LSLEVIDILNRALFDRGRDLDDVITDKESGRSFTESMPSAYVHISLVDAAHRNRDKPWASNDIFDVDGLSIAVPYCDMVVTERHACHVVRTARLPQAMNTEVVPKLNDLMEWLNRQ
jgi:hypothetical protein